MRCRHSIRTPRNTWLIERAAETGRFITESLKAALADVPGLLEIRGKGLMLGIEMVKDRTTKEPATAECAAVLESAREMGLLLGKGGLRGQTEDQAKKTVEDAIRQSEEWRTKHPGK